MTPHPNPETRCIFQAPTPLPEAFDSQAVFLAGSIEQGTAEEWQEWATKALARMGATVLNPRRAEWDASWPQSPDFAPFREQVEWELDALDRADHILMHFDPATKSPITLLELGLHAESGKVVVSCAPEFWRYGNVALVCERIGVPLFRALGHAVSEVGTRLSGRADSGGMGNG